MLKLIASLSFAVLGLGFVSTGPAFAGGAPTQKSCCDEKCADCCKDKPCADCCKDGKCSKDACGPCKKC